MSTKNEKTKKKKKKKKKTRRVSQLQLSFTIQLSPLKRPFARALFPFVYLHLSIRNTMADAAAPAAADDGAKRRTFRRFSYRGVDLEQLLELKTEEMVQLFGARQRRRYVFFCLRRMEMAASGDYLSRTGRGKISRGAPRRRGGVRSNAAVAAAAVDRRLALCLARRVVVVFISSRLLASLRPCFLFFLSQKVEITSHRVGRAQFLANLREKEATN